ncbi:hypothetical protein ACA29_07335 [Lederbergia galactosidilytica]|uniref:RamC N-terminal domain-containing protein n=1 Tax=Lederbergia galactosidilytica TaxID=217031 RepID=A0A0Q9YAG1_9BACI|nr:hypothetical protein ACA29_07335 [Lederbergia galactosidilytica]
MENKIYHQNYILVDSEWYESFDSYQPSNELIGIVRSILPLTWHVRSILPLTWQTQKDGIWFHVFPPKLQLEEQGWKIHISAKPDNCKEILLSLLPMYA